MDEASITDNAPPFCLEGGLVVPREPHRFPRAVEHRTAVTCNKGSVAF